MASLSAGGSTSWFYKVLLSKRRTKENIRVLRMTCDSCFPNQAVRKLEDDVQLLRKAGGMCVLPHKSTEQHLKLPVNGSFEDSTAWLPLAILSR